LPTLRQLEYFVAIAETLHFRNAAKRVNASQPTLSGQLKALEDRLGVQLVERGASAIMLTEIGERILEIARRILLDAGEIREVAAGDQGSLNGVIQLGLPPTIGPYLLPSIMPDLRRHYPDMKLHVREELPETLPLSLGHGKYDLIIAPFPLLKEEFHSVALFKEPLLLTVSRQHRLASRTRIYRSDLVGEDVMTLGPGYYLHDIVVALCEEIGARVRLEYEGTSLDTLREMVATDLGVTFLPGLYVKTVLSRDHGLRTLRFAGKKLQRSVGMAWRTTSGRMEQYLELSDLVRATIERKFPDMDPGHASRVHRRNSKTVKSS